MCARRVVRACGPAMSDAASGSGSGGAQLPEPRDHDDILRIFNQMREQVRAHARARPAGRRGEARRAARTHARTPRRPPIGAG